MKLASKIILLFVIAVIAITSISSHFTSRQFLIEAKRQHKAMAQRLEELADQQQLQRAFVRGDSVYLQQIIRDRESGSVQLRFVKFQSRDPALRPRLQQAFEKLQNGDGWTSAMSGSNSGDRTLLSYFSLPTEDGLAAIEMASPLETVDSQARQAWLNSLVSIATIGLLSVVVIILAGVRMIARPLDALADKMKRVGEGDLASDLTIHTHDELGQLAVSVNEMCDRLREQKQAIEQQTADKLNALDQLRHADRLKTVGQLAAGIAHEIGTPLNVISGRASMLIASAGDQEALERNVNAIQTETSRITQIVNGMLNFARQADGQQQPGDLREVVTHAVQLLQPLAGKRHVELRLQLPETAAEAEFDFNQMQQVVTNLIDNAIDASPDGECVDIRLHRDPAGGSSIDAAQADWTIEVVDRGAGLSEEAREKMFEPFFTTKNVGEGTGLGLSIVHGIVEEHGGSVVAYSPNEGGTRIAVTLPAIAPDSTTAPANVTE